MYTLAINTASSTTAIAIFEGAKLIAEDSWPAQNREADSLMPAITKIAPDLQKVSKVICISGPGSFTGLRIGISTANTIAYLNKADLYAIPTFEYLSRSRAQSRQSDQRERFFFNARAQSRQSEPAQLVYAGSRGVYLNGTETPLAELYETLTQKNITKAYGDITEAQKAELKEIEFIENTEKFSETITKIAATDLTEFASKVPINPTYIKAPSITMPKSG